MYKQRWQIELFFKALKQSHASFKNAGESAFGLRYAIVDPTTADRVADDAARKRNRGLRRKCGRDGLDRS